MRNILLLPTDQIHVMNPRVRNRAHHKEIIQNIAAVGLKRPITVSNLSVEGGKPGYALVCGQGRLEAFRELGIAQIPAVVVDAGETDCLVMSLVENLARRRHSAIESLRQIRALQLRGYDDQEIARKVGATASWVGMILQLLSKGEERLVAAVETGLIPITLAIDISRSDDKATQQLLTEAYTNGSLRGRKLSIVRRLLQRRSKSGKSDVTRGVSSHPHGRVDVDHLKRIYEREVEKQQLLLRKADITQARLMFVVKAMSDLLDDKAFTSLLTVEGIDSLPRALSERLNSR